MSDFQNDGRIARNHKNPFDESIEASVRDQIPKKLLAKLREMDMGHKVRDLWNRGNTDRSAWLERQQEYLAQWDEFLLPVNNGPFELSSNLHIPMPFIVAKTYHARMMQAIAANDPVAEARRPDSADRAEAVSQMMRFAINDWVNRGQGMDELLDRWIWEWCTTGVGIKKWRWDVHYSKYMDVETVTKPGPPEYRVAPDGTEQAVPTFVKVEQEVERVRKCYDQPACESVLGEDFIMIGGEGDPEQADHCFHRQWLTKSELYTLAYRKVFDEEIVTSIIAESGRDSRHLDQAGNIKEQRRLDAGQMNIQPAIELDRYAIIEAYMRADIDDSGIDSDIVLWVHQKSGKILRATYLHRVNRNGKRPFIKIDFHKRTGQTYGIGLIETLYPLSKEMDMMHNTRIDFGMLSTMPFAFYRASSSLEPEKIRFEPGQLIPVDNPQTDVYFPNLGNRTSFGMQEEQAIQTMVERLTGISDLSLGANSGTQGALRTATGARALVGEASTNLDVHLKRLFRGYKQSLQYLFSLMQQRLPADFAYKVTGDDGSEYWSVIKDKAEIEYLDVDFEIDPSSAASNPDIRLQRAQSVLSTVMNPLLLQTGVVKPSGLFEATKDYLLALGKKNFAKFLAKPADYSVQLSPEDVANRVLRGIDVPVLPTDDNQGFLAYFEELMKHDELLGQFDQQQIMALQIQAKKREQLLQAMQQQQAQAANVQQQQTNAAQATNPAGQPGVAPGGPQQ